MTTFITQPSWPDDLTELVSRCRRVSLRVDNSLKEDVDLKWKKVNPKKIHEVVNFSQIIGETCAEKGVRHVVDIGSGLVIHPIIETYLSSANNRKFRCV